jgi:glycosyltransferase involved in cell wall biosynthesis
VIGYVWPEPKSSAAGSHMLSILKLFRAQNWQVTFASPAQLSSHRADLPALGIKEVAIELNSNSFDDFIVKLQPDLVLFDRFMMEEQFGWRVAKYCPQALRVLDTEDLHSLRQARHQAFKQERSVSDHDLVSDVCLREVAAIFRSDLTLMVSSVEKSLLIEQFQVPGHLLHVCPFMMDLTPLNRVENNFAEREHFISIGNFRHAPNWDAVLWLKQTIWPAIKKQLPQAQLNIYGAYPPPKATALHNEKQGFLVKGWVDDAQLAMRSAKVCLAPLRFGAGIKGKLAEAMLCGTPSVTTNIGSEGMKVDELWSGVEVSLPDGDAAQKIADGAVRLYQDTQLWANAQQQGLAMARKMFDEQQNGKQLVETINRALEHKDKRRQQNFIGAMLNHHSMQSTKYMAQWIESKNKLAGLQQSLGNN